MYCVIKVYSAWKPCAIKNADVRHPSCTVVMYRRKSAAPVHNVLIRLFYLQACITLSSCG